MIPSITESYGFIPEEHPQHCGVLKGAHETYKVSINPDQFYIVALSDITHQPSQVYGSSLNKI